MASGILIGLPAFLGAAATTLGLPGVSFLKPLPVALEVRRHKHPFWSLTPFKEVQDAHGERGLNLRGLKPQDARQLAYITRDRDIYPQLQLHRVK